MCLFGWNRFWIIFNKVFEFRVQWVRLAPTIAVQKPCQNGRIYLRIVYQTGYNFELV